MSAANQATMPESPATSRSTDGLGDAEGLQCEKCGKRELGLGWPTPTLCMECGRKRDMNEAKACPFCGIVAAMDMQENDGSKFWLVCMVCEAQGPKTQLKDLAIWEWNRRKSPND